MLVGLMSMLIALMTSLNQRRREMAILRVLGATLTNILAFIILETLIITCLAIFLACITKLIFEWMLGPWLQSRYGVYLQDPVFSYVEFIYILIMLSFALIISIIPALTAMKSALKDGLSVKV